MTIRKQSADPQRPFATLLPIVDFLVSVGNEAVDGGFLQNPDGWRCRMARPVDFKLIRGAFELPPNIQLSDDHDSILDRLSWCVIEGPGAQG